MDPQAAWRRDGPETKAGCAASGGSAAPERGGATGWERSSWRWIGARQRPDGGRTENVNKALWRAHHRPRFSTRILRGDRIGLIGPTAPARRHCSSSSWRAGAGRGRVRRGTRQTVAYFDQLREPSSTRRRRSPEVISRAPTTWRSPVTAPTSSVIGGISFFAPAARSPVKSFVRRRAQPAAAGPAVRPAGQRAGARRADQRSGHRDPRSARRPAGPVRRHGVLVSHDRAFLDNVVTQVIAAEGDGAGRNTPAATMTGCGCARPAKLPHQLATPKPATPKKGRCACTRLRPASRPS